MCNRALSCDDLATWLRSDLLANADAMIDLIDSGDIKIVTMLDQFTVVRAHNESSARFGREIRLPMMASASA
jgi:hypothetical protein